MNGVLAALLVYVLVQFVIGIVVSRRVATGDDYILAGRSLGAGLVAFSVFASFFGAEAIVASAGAVYEGGFGGAVVDPFAYGVALILAGVGLAGPLWKRGLITFADLFAQRYSRGVERLVVLLLLPGSLFWAAAQIRAFGQVLAGNSTLTITTAITIAALLVAAYSVVGGLMADSVTDLFQGLAVIAGLVVLTIAVAAGTDVVPTAATVGMPDAAAGALAAADAGREGLGDKIEGAIVAVCGTLVSVELISRFLGARAAQVATLGTCVGGIMYLAVGLMPVYLGLAGQGILPGLAEPEQIVTKLAELYLSPPLRIAFVGAIISAILSTVHSALHGPSSQLSHNIVMPLLPRADPRMELWVVRGCVMGLSIAAYLLALASHRIHDLVEIASAFGSAGVLVVAVFALHTSFGGVPSAYGALGAGMLVWSIARFGFEAPMPFTLALGSSFALYVGVALIERRWAIAQLNRAPAASQPPSTGRIAPET